MRVETTWSSVGCGSCLACQPESFLLCEIGHLHVCGRQLVRCSLRTHDRACCATQRQQVQQKRQSCGNQNSTVPPHSGISHSCSFCLCDVIQQVLPALHAAAAANCSELRGRAVTPAPHPRRHSGNTSLVLPLLYRALWSPVAGSVAAVSACQSLNKPCPHLTISSLALSACSASLRPGRSGSSCSRAITVPSKNSTPEQFRKFTATRLTATGLEGVVGCLAGLSWRVGLDTSQDCLLSRRGTNWEPR